MLQTKLTPNLGTFIETIEEELDFAIKKEFPPCGKTWTPVKIHPIVLRLVARISARIFVGFPLCRDEDWLDTSVHYTENVFRTVTAMRLFPKVLQPAVSLLLPPAWKVPQNLKFAQSLIVPLVIERREAQKSGDPSYQKPNDLLQWMMDGADVNDGQPNKLAHRQLLLTLASIHTTTMAAVHSFYDMATRPEYIAALREEIEQAVKEDGGWQKTTLTKMRKLDSFMKESQRVNPPSLRRSPITCLTDMSLLHAY